MDETEKIIEEIINGIDSSYTKNEKIRYVYLELGKRLSKDADFFFSVFNKLDKKNLSVEELKSIYNNENLTKKVVCKSCSKALKTIFDKIGIESQIIKTVKNNTIKDNNSTLDIYHYFVCCKGDDDKNYFLTLSADLGNIQMGYRTKHFANNIPYSIDGQIVYQGGEILNSVMSEQEIESIDKKLGYLKNYYFKKNKGKVVSELDYNDYGIEIVKKSYFKNNLYYTHLSENTKNQFYRVVQSIPCEYGKIIQLNNCNVNDIKKLDLSKWKNNIIVLVNEKILSELNEEINDEDENRLYDCINDNNVDEWMTLMLKIINRIDISKLDISSNFNPIILVKKLNDLFTEIEKDDINVYSIRNSILTMAYQFIDPDLILSKNKNDYASNYYIAKKFESEMPKLLELGVSTDFSVLGYSEQTETIEKLLDAVFQELSIKNSGNMKTYDENLSGVKNRIITSAVKDRKTDEYAFLFHIIGDSNDDTYTYLYEPMFNTMSDVDLFSVAEDYIIVTSKINPTIDNIEKIDELENIGERKK